MWFLLLALSCAKEIPPHLRVDTTPPTAFEASRSGLVGRDPLVRRPDPGPVGAWSGLHQGQAIAAWADVARQARPQPTHWAEVEALNRGTIAVPLSRGGLLAGLEFAQGDGGVEHQQDIAAWLGLTRVAARPATQRPSPPIDWLPGPTINEKMDTAHHIARRWVLRGWLDGPDIELDAVAEALEGSAYTALSDSPYGRLIHARASGSQADSSDAKRALWTATEAALSWAMADGQRAKQTELERRRNYRTAHQEDLVSAKLSAAFQGLSQNASDDDNTGMALIAIEAARLNRVCADPPCDGLDRVRSIHDARVWGPMSGQLATVWEVIALKEALDTLSLALDQPILHRRLPQVFEAIAGVRGASIQLPWLRHRTENPVLLAALSQLSSGVPQTTRENTILAVTGLLEQRCDQAMSGDLPPSINDMMGRLHDRIKKKLASD